MAQTPVEPQVDEPKEEETQPEQSAQDYPDFKGDAKQDYVDINDPDDGNKTYEELQSK